MLGGRVVKSLYESYKLPENSDMFKETRYQPNLSSLRDPGGRRTGWLRSGDVQSRWFVLYGLMVILRKYFYRDTVRDQPRGWGQNWSVQAHSARDSIGRYLPRPIEGWIGNTKQDKVPSTEVSFSFVNGRYLALAYPITSTVPEVLGVRHS